MDHKSLRVVLIHQYLYLRVDSIVVASAVAEFFVDSGVPPAAVAEQVPVDIFD